MSEGKNGETNYKNVVFDFEALDECPFCAHNVMIPNGRINWLGIDFWYVLCPECGLKFMNPRPTRESYKDFYKNLFWQQKIRNVGFHQSGQMWQTGTYKWDNEKKWDPKEGLENRLEKHREQRAKTIIPVINKYVNLNSDSRVLEVGCGFGVTLGELHKQFGSYVYAIEPSEEAQKVIKETGSIEFLASYAEDLEKIGKDGKKFNVIIFSHSLENTVDPASVVKFAEACLDKNGIIYVQTPNLLVFDQMNPYHPYIFSNASLGFLAGKLGLSYERISEPKDKMLTVVFSRL
ncbi:MAG: class I SAM-dependent methyltransferase [bacterium]|nr:class I SAM-dependent methyltransferase [bacterium]